MYFKRATLASPNDMNAWLLLGHELIELRNPSAALAAYQSASVLPRAKWDVRPWYAIGQLFELINQYAFAVYYHSKAAEIDNKDTRIWRALGNCFLKLNRNDEALKCTEKLRILGDKGN
jgi:anaphase-promoting complex subunit 8